MEAIALATVLMRSVIKLQAHMFVDMFKMTSVTYIKT